MIVPDIYTLGQGVRAAGNEAVEENPAQRQGDAQPVAEHLVDEFFVILYSEVDELKYLEQAMALWPVILIHEPLSQDHIKDRYLDVIVPWLMRL